MVHVKYFGSAGGSTVISANSIDVLLGAQGVAIVEFDQMVTAAGMLAEIGGLDSTNAGRKAFGIIHNTEVSGADMTFDPGTGLYSAVWGQDSEAQSFKTIGTRGSYESGRYRPHAIIWSFDSRKGITGETTGLIDAMYLIGSTSSKIEVTWRGVGSGQ